MISICSTAKLRNRRAQGQTVIKLSLSSAIMIKREFVCAYILSDKDREGFRVADLYYIEDDRNIALAVREYLEQRSFKVTICPTLSAAKQQLREYVPTCVLLDWNM